MDSCPPFLELRAELSRLERGSQEYITHRDTLRGRICNKQNRRQFVVVKSEEEIGHSKILSNHCNDFLKDIN